MDRFSKLKDNRRDLLIIFVVVLIYYVHHYLGIRLGMNFEESRDANAYLLYMDGYLPYRDFQWIYGPFSFFIYPFLMKLFGVNLIVLRASYIVFGSLVIPLVYYLAKRIMPAFWAGLASFLSIIFFNIPYYTFNHIFAVLGALVCLLYICRFIEDDKKILNLIFAGMFCSLALMTKPLILGVSLFTAISIFLISFRSLGPLRERVKKYALFSMASFFLPLIYIFYFFTQTWLKGIAVEHSYFAQDSSLFTEQAPRILNAFSLFINRFTGVIPLQQIMGLSSFSDFKKVFTSAYDNFIFLLPFVVSALILVIILKSKHAKEGIRHRIYSQRSFLLLFAIVSLFISFESTVMNHSYNRAYSMQIPFILSIYLLYNLRIFYKHKRLIVATFIMLFVLYISFLPFFRHTYGKLRKYTQSLNLIRAKGISVTASEKQLYESLSLYLKANLLGKDKLAVFGYYPNLSFLTNQRNIFEKDDYIFPNLESLLSREKRTGHDDFVIKLLENKIISKMQQEKPKILLLVDASYLANFMNLSTNLKDYIQNNYSLDMRFQPAPILGREDAVARVNSYKLKER